jgi:hypothetical protein
VRKSGKVSNTFKKRSFRENNTAENGENFVRNALIEFYSIHYELDIVFIKM